jgi:putative PIN family toxin of toxin-antitoxin system
MNHYVLDTNIWVSIFFRHRFEDLVTKVIEQQLVLFTCNEQLNEFADAHIKHAKIKKMLPNATEDYAELLYNACMIADVHNRYKILKDYKDNYLVDLAHQTKSILVTNDKGFDVLKAFKTPPVLLMDIKQFYNKINL